jgi:hypothetical protein
MHKAIDLGRKWDDDAGTPIAMSDLKETVHYPDFHISNTEEARLLDIPDEGEATIKFKVVHRSHSEEDRNGKKRRRCSLTIEVQKIDFEDNPKPKKKDYGDDARKSFADYFKGK